MTKSDEIIVLRRFELEELIESAVSRGVAVALAQTADSVKQLEEGFHVIKRLLNHHEVARYMGVCTETALTYLRRGEIPSTKKGKVYWVRREDLEAWLAGREDR